MRSMVEVFILAIAAPKAAHEASLILLLGLLFTTLFATLLAPRFITMPPLMALLSRTIPLLLLTRRGLGRGRRRGRRHLSMHAPDAIASRCFARGCCGGRFGRCTIARHPGGPLSLGPRHDKARNPLTWAPLIHARRGIVLPILPTLT